MTLVPVKTLRLVAFAVLVWTVFLGAPAFAQRAFLATPETLDRILARAQPGDSIGLAAGDYDRVTLREQGFGTAPLVIHAAGSGPDARIHSLSITDSTNVVLRELHLVAQPGPADPFRITGSREISLENLTVSGPPVVAGDDRPPHRLNGLRIEDTNRVTLTGSRFRDLSSGVTILRGEDIRLEGNDFRGLTSAGILLRQVTGALVAANLMTDFKRPGDRGAFPTMIQMSTEGTTAPSVGVVIRDNQLLSGEGTATQSIVLRNQLLEDNRAGPDMFLRDLTVEENLIINAHANGILVGAAEGVLIRRNTVVQDATSKGLGRHDRFWTPRIIVEDLTRDLILLGNVAHTLPEKRWQEDWIVAGNVIVQNHRPTASDHYDRVFASVNPGRVARPLDFAARPGGPLDGLDVGAPRLTSLLEAERLERVLPLREERALFEVLRLDPVLGAMIGYGGAGADDRLERTLGGPIELGDGNAAFVLDRTMTAPFFEAEAFRMRLSLRPAYGPASAGEVLRIHQNLSIAVTDRGAVHVDFATALSRPIRLRSPATRIFRDGLLDLELSYDALTGWLRLTADGELVAENRTSGPTRPVEHWGLSFGNPFGVRKSFDGTVDAFTLDVRHPRFKPLARAGSDL